MTENKIKNGDIFDIGQTVNGISKFVWVGGKWHYFNKEVDWGYEYSQEVLTNLITNDEFGDVDYLGNIFYFL